MNSSGSEQAPVAGSYEYCNEPPGYIKSGTFTDKLSDC